MTVEVQLWREDGGVMLVVAHDAVEAAFRDARGEPGSGSLSLPLGSVYTPGGASYTASELLARDLVVKHVEDGVELFAWTIEESRVTVAGDQLVVQASGRGLLCWLEWGVAYPVRGIRPGSLDHRVAGFGTGMNYVDAGFDPATYGPAVAHDFTDPADVPDTWPDPTMRAIWAGSGPMGSIPPGEEAWFWRSFTTDTGSWCRIDATGDDFVEVWLDDELLITQDGRDMISPGHNRSTVQRRRLAAGVHMLMVRGKQSDLEDLEDLGIDPTPANAGPAFVAVRVATITGNDDAGTLLLRTGDTWNATLVAPGWTPGLTFNMFLNEAADRDVGHRFWAAYTWTHDVDSNGEPFPHVVTRTWPVGTDLLKIAQDLSEAYGLDVWGTPDKGLHMALTRGTDRTDTVRLFPGGNLPSYRVVKNLKVRTVAIVKSREGFIETSDSTGLADHGRAETRIDLSSVDSPSRVAEQAAQILAPLAAPTRETDGDRTNLVPWGGATPYVDFGIADDISVPDGEGGWTTATVMGIAWQKADPEVWSVELDLAQKGARRLTRSVDQRVLTLAVSGGAASAGGRVTSATK